MKKIFFIALFSFILFFNPIKSYSSSGIPQYYGGTVISLQEYQTYVDYCFYSSFFILEEVYEWGSESSLDLNYRLYSIEGGKLVLGYGEFIISCYTEQGALQTYTNTNIVPKKYNNTLKRGFSDRCLGIDWFNGYWFIYSCNPETGAWSIIPNSVGGSASDSAGTYECINQNGRYYGGSSYLHLVINKKKIFGVNYDDSYYYRTFACVETEENIEKNPTLTELKVGLTTSRVSSDIGSSGGTGGSTGGTGASDTKIDEIKTQLTELKNSNSTFQTQNLGKLSEVKSEILLQNEYLAVSQNVLVEKLDNLEQKNQLLKQDLNNKIELENNNLKNAISENLETQTNDLKTKIDESNLDLTTKINNNQLEINSLEDSINGYNSDNLEGRNEILGRLSGLENQISGLGASLENIENNQGSGNGEGNGTGDLSALGQGLTNIDNTLKNGLQNENGKPYLESINKNINDSFTPVSSEDYNSALSNINNSISSSLNTSFSKYSNVLGFGSNYGNKPVSITVSLMGKTYTLLDFSFLDNYVSIIRSLFLSLAYLYGFMNLLRGGK